MIKLLKKFTKHLVIIFTIGFFVFWPILHYFHVLNPLEKELADFKFSDIYFGHFQDQKLDSEIYFVDLAYKDKTTSRTEITNFLSFVNSTYTPKVIAIDAKFTYDSKISDSINKNLSVELEKENIVLSYNLVSSDNEWLKDGTELPLDYNIVHEGFSNNLVALEEYGVERFFQPRIEVQGVTEEHFSLKIAEIYGKDNSVIDKNKLMINFAYKYPDVIDINDKSSYHLLKDKIVIIGLFTKGKDGRPIYNEDVHYTPSNPHYFGKSPPNMYGAEINANIVSNIIHNNFISYYPRFSSFLNIFLSIVVYLLLLYFMGKSHRIFIAVSILMQFALVSFFIIFSLFMVAKFNVYLDLTLLGVITFFGVEFVTVIEEMIEFIESKIEDIKKERKLKKNENEKA